MTMVIVGAGLAGLRTAEGIRRAGYTGGIVLVGDEVHLPYDRPPLSKAVVRGERDDTTLEPAGFFEELRIELRLGVAATGVEPSSKTLHLSDGSVLPYDELIIATGLRPRRMPGSSGLSGVHVLRSKEDAGNLRAAALPGRKAMVVGAGFIGCEVAASLRQCGLEVTLVEPLPTPLAAVLGETVGSLIARMHTAEGISVRTGVGIRALVGTDAVSGAVLTDGSTLAADLVVTGIGSTPATQWLEGTGLDAGPGIATDGTGRTGIPGIWAVGDASAWRSGASWRRVEHWSNVGDQVRILVPALLGLEPPMMEPVPYFWSDQFDIKIQALGMPATADTVHVVEDDGRKFLAYYERAGEFVAVVGAGVPGKVMKNRKLLAARTPMAALLEQTEQVTL